MDPVQRAIWYLESHFSDDLTLQDVADASGVSRYHLTRAFGLSTGCSVMRYLRARRLTEAAKSLAKGAPDILSIAISVGYGSHEAFTRAFSEQFGASPAEVRLRASTGNLELMEPIKMDETLFTDLLPPRFEDGRRMTIAGLMERYDDQSAAGIPSQWQRFLPYLGNVDGQKGGLTYGVCCKADEQGNIDYLSGVEVADGADLPAEFRTVALENQRYAVFRHEGHISGIRRTWKTILGKWLPESDYALIEAPDFELYSEDFDPVAETGYVEIWIPIVL